MIPLPSSTKILKKDKNRAVFEIKGLYPGYGATIGNALRRVLLSSITGAAATQVKIKGAPHEFSTIPNVLEDTIIIIQNLKKLRFKIFEGDSHTIRLGAKGEKEIKASDFNLPSQVEIANPDAHIATLTKKSAELEMEIRIEKGTGYSPAERRVKEKQEIGVIPLDAIFTPVRRVNFEVENMRVGERTDFDKLELDVETDGILTPEQVFVRACEILIEHFSLLEKEMGGTKEEKEKGEKESKKGKDKEKSKTAKKSKKDVSKIEIEDLKLSTRTQNALTENSIKTVGGLKQKTEKDLLEIDGFGNKGLKEVKKELKRLNVSLK